MNPQDPQPGLHCLYPPRLASEVDITEQTEAGVTRYVVRNTATSRYFLLKQPEYRILSQFDGTLGLQEVACGGREANGPRVSMPALVTFLTKLDSLGLLARGGSDDVAAAAKSERGLYIRFQLFNPNQLLGWLDRTLGWLLTKPFIVASFALMLVVTFGLFVRADEVSIYSAYTYREYGLASIVASVLVITILHEFAHGLACKHFGGDVQEMGVLLIYYVLPGFYCNVSDVYRVGRRRERLWVIFAGIYWQLLVGATGGLLWLLATPYTVLADLSFLAFVGATFNILINCNPLIKLDGYYALSQALGIVNLQGRSSEYVKALFSRAIGEPQVKKADSQRPLLYVSYWVCSIIYSVVLIWLILGWISGELMDALRFGGVLLTLILGVLLTERWWKPAFKAALAGLSSFTRKSFSGGFAEHAISAQGVSTMAAQPAVEKDGALEATPGSSTPRRWLSNRRRIVKLSFAVILLVALIAPWEAATGSDCTLLLPPEREGVVRANTDAVLKEIFVHPGDTVREGARVASLTNPDIEDRLTQITSEIERLNSNNSKIEEELHVRSETMLSAGFKEYERKRLASEFKRESEQIAEARGANAAAGTQPLPPSLAVLQSEIELKDIELEHNRREAERYKKLLEQGLVGEQLYDRAVAEARASEAALRAARSRLDAALVDHRRNATGVETSSLVAETEARSARSNFESLIAELHSNRQQIESLRQRDQILRREYEGMTISAPKAGVVLGDDLRKMLGRRYGRGEEICRIGELESFMLRIDVSEREIASVRIESPVRFKLKTVPGRVFTGRVSKINAEPIPNQYAQHFYPVEVIVDNADGLLRPGMTGFARISFGRQSIGLILAQKFWQALRPELWLF